MPAFTLSLAHATLLHLSPPELVRVAAATGYEAVGIRLVPMERPGEAPPRLAEQLRWLPETKRALTATGVYVLDVEVVQLRDGREPPSYLPVIEAAGELGARHLLTNVYTPDANLAEDSCAALCDLAQPLGLAAALEFVSFSDVSTLSQAVEIVRNSGRDNASVLIDLLHFHSSGAPLDVLEEVPRGLVHYVHVCDGPGEVPPTPDERRRIAREGRLLPGEGAIDVAGMLRRLPPGIVYAVEVQDPARARALGAEAWARLAREATVRYLSDLHD